MATQYIFPGRIDKIEIGLAADDNCDITNVILMNWERIHEVRPHLVASSPVPYGTCPWLQGHSWIMGSFSLLSYNDCIYTEPVVGADVAYDNDGDSHCITWFSVTYDDENGNNRVSRFYKGLIYRITSELLNYDDSVWVYHFVASYVDDIYVAA